MPQAHNIFQAALSYIFHHRVEAFHSAAVFLGDTLSLHTIYNFIVFPDTIFLLAAASNVCVYRTRLLPDMSGVWEMELVAIIVHFRSI